MGKAEVECFLTHLAAEKGLSASTHRQALSALIFLYGKVLGLQLPWLAEIGRPVPVRRLPVVLSRDEVAAVLGGLQGVHRVLARLLYGTGMRISEGLQLRVKDVDFAHRALVVREGKGGKDRVVMLPDALVAELRDQLGAARQLWAADVEAGHRAWTSAITASTYGRATPLRSATRRLPTSRQTPPTSSCPSLTPVPGPMSDVGGRSVWRVWLRRSNRRD